MSVTRVRCVVLVALAALVGCGKNPQDAKAPAQPAAPTGTVPPVRIVPPVGPAGPGNDHVAPPPRPAKERPFVGFRRVPVTAGELAEFVAHVPGPVRGLYASDAELFKDLGGVAYAWEFTGGPVRLRVAFEEEGQSTVPKHYPEREDAWTVNAKTGRVVFWMRRNVSDKVNAALAQSRRPPGDTSSGALGMMAPPGGFDATVGLAKPLWYGWKRAAVNEGRPADAVPAWDDEPVALHSVEATEVAEGGAKPRRAKLTIYAQRLKPE